MTIRNSTIASVQPDAFLVYAPSGTAANITLERVTGRGGSARFLYADGFVSVTVRNCALDRTSGIDLRNPLAPADVTITRNRARNIQRGPNLGQFLQLNNVNTAAADVSWNEVVNVYGQSEVEDNISIYKSSNVSVHDNYVQGAYPRDYRDSFSGSGIVVGDDGGSNNRVFSNQIVDTTNIGIGIVAGHDNSVRGNRLISDGRLDNGTALAAANVGLAVWNAYGDSTWANNRATGNVIGWIHAGPYRNDMWMPETLADKALNRKLRTRVTHKTEVHERQLWLAKLKKTRTRIGP